eukprot:GEZU01012227.1.p2 GENE.GEZU01012227.1~~GEZU01012227.1.p2  ORF type:complete len:143 (+),score=27.06 GEZU01012227.1:412-840(+)
MNNTSNCLNFCVVKKNRHGFQNRVLHFDFDLQKLSVLSGGTVKKEYYFSDIRSYSRNERNCCAFLINFHRREPYNFFAHGMHTRNLVCLVLDKIMKREAYSIPPEIAQFHCVLKKGLVRMKHKTAPESGRNYYGNHNHNHNK